MNNYKLRKICIIIFIFIVFMTTNLAIISKLIKDMFGDISLRQIMSHIQIGTVDGNGFDIQYIIDNVKYIVLFILNFIGAIFIYKLIFNYKKIYLFRNKIKLNLKVLCILSYIYLFISSCICINIKMHVIDYMNTQKSIFIEKNFAKLDISNYKNNDRKNLLIIYLESFESEFNNEKIFKCKMIDKLNKIKNDGISFTGYQRTHGGTFTADGIFAGILGIHVSTLNSIYSLHSHKNYSFDLKKINSIFQIFEKDNYNTFAICGTSKYYTCKDKVFKNHGINYIYGKEDFKNINKKFINKQWGGVNDAYVLEESKKIITNLSKGDRNFAGIIETIDTHFPNGNVMDDDVIYGDIRDAYIATSNYVSSFIDWAKTQTWYKNTVILIIGDHCWQDFKFSFTNYVKQLKKREIYNCFLNSSKKQLYKDRVFYGMDIAPTILDAMNIEFNSYINDEKISHSRIGLGSSLFSKDKTLLEEYGLKFIHNEFFKISSFYDKLF